MGVMGDQDKDDSDSFACFFNYSTTLACILQLRSLHLNTIRRMTLARATDLLLVPRGILQVLKAPLS